MEASYGAVAVLGHHQCSGRDPPRHKECDLVLEFHDFGNGNGNGNDGDDKDINSKKSSANRSFCRDTFDGKGANQDKLL
jgi:hypothetical protein